MYVPAKLSKNEMRVKTSRRLAVENKIAGLNGLQSEQVRNRIQVGYRNSTTK